MLWYCLHFQLHEVALNYHIRQTETKVIDEYSQFKWESISSHLDLTQECRPNRRGRNHPSSSHYESLIPVVHRCCMSMVLDGFEPSKYNSCDVCVNYFSESSHSCGRLTLSASRTSSLFRPFDLSLNDCLVIMPNYNPNEYVSMCCDNNFSPFDLPKSFKSSSAQESTTSPASSPSSSEPSKKLRTPLHKHSDPYVKWAFRNHRKKKCQKLRKQRLNKWSPVYDMKSLRFENSTQSSVNISGLGCNNNHSLTFLAMDSRDSDMFARNLGFNLKLRKNESLMVLVDSVVSTLHDYAMD